MNPKETPEIIDAELVLDTFKKRFRTFLVDATNPNKIGKLLAFVPEGDLGIHIGKRLMHRYRILTEHSGGVDVPGQAERFWYDLAAFVLFHRGLSLLQLEGLLLLLAKKRVDYGCKNITGFGEIGIIVRAMDKVHRLENMSARGGETAVGESYEDALNDVIGYAGVAYLFLTEQWMDDTIEQPGEPEPEVTLINFTPVSGLVFVGARGMHWMVNYTDHKTMISRRADSKGHIIVVPDAIPAESGQEAHQVRFCLGHIPTRSYIFTQILEHHYRANSPIVLWNSTDLIAMAAEKVLGIKVVA